MKKAILTIKDEVNVKIRNLELDTRKKLVKQFKFLLPYARHTPAFKLGRWDGMVSYFALGGSTYINLLPEILPVLIKEGYEIEIDDQRDYRTDFLFSKVDANTLTHKVWPDGHRLAGQPIVLMDHQIQTINCALANPQSLQEVATAAGKTIITATLSMMVESYGRTLVVVPNRTLVTQTEEDYINLGLDVGVIYGGRHEYDKTHTICTWQSLDAMIKASKKGKALDVSLIDFIEGNHINNGDGDNAIKAIIVDECLDGDTLITTPSGKVPIKDIRPGDTVINLDEKTKTFKEDTVVRVHENLTKSESEEMFELEFDDSSIIRVTGNHEILTDSGWVRADQLTSDMVVTSQDRKYASSTRLKGRTKTEKPKKVYNLHIKDDHNYVAAGVVVKNCHGMKAQVLKDMMTSVLAKVPLRWGLTGTIPKEKFDFLALQTAIGDVVNQVSAKSLQEKGILANCHVNIMQLKDYADHSNYQSEMKYLLGDIARLEHIASMVTEINESGNTLVLVNHIKTGKLLEEMIPNSVFLSGSTDEKVRKEEYDKIRTVDNRVVIATYGIAAVGLNINRIFNLVLLEPGKSFVRVIQSIGRSLRIAKDKDHAEIWDITSDCKFAKRHLTQRKKFYREAQYDFTVTKVDWK